MRSVRADFHSNIWGESDRGIRDIVVGDIRGEVWAVINSSFVLRDVALALRGTLEEDL